MTIKTLLSLFIFGGVVVTIVGCAHGSGTLTRPDALHSLETQFGPVDAGAPVPLETVAVPAPEPPDPTEARTYRLVHGQPAPVDGILFTDAAAAYVVSEYTALHDRFQLALTQQHDRDYARLLHDTETLTLQINSDRERFRLLFQGEENYISTLETMTHQDNTWHDIWQVLGAGGIGVLVGVIVGFVVAIAR